jgi:pseudouridine-5'-phosphate glycosidase
MTIPVWMDVSDDVQHALRRGQPIVALESAVFSHGLPHDDARALAGRLDTVVRETGAVPACVAVRSGRVSVGVRAEELAFLFAPGAIKIADRDLAVAAAQRLSGGTTVAGTLAVAHALGLRVMATGGIGGVHLGAEHTGDVSADLMALARYPLVVVCAGPKAVCDPRRSVEVLDSLGITVVGYRTGVLPAFLARSSGIPLTHRVETADDVAAVWRAKADIAGSSALVVVQAPPSDSALDEAELSEAVALAVQRAHDGAVAGADVTPFLLAALSEITGGRSTAANLAVLAANARLAAEVAVASQAPLRRS